MTENLAVSHQGSTDLVADRRALSPLDIRLECPDGLEAGSDVRLSIDSFHSFRPEWRLDAPRVEGGGRIVLGHGLPTDWTERVRGGIGPAGGNLVGRPINEVYLCTVQVRQALTAGTRLVFPLHINASIHAAIAAALHISVRPPQAEGFRRIGPPVPLTNCPGQPLGLEVRARRLPDGTASVRVFAADAGLNPVEVDAADLTFAVDARPLAPERTGDKRTAFVVELPDQKVTRLTVRHTQRDWTATGPPLYTPDAGEDRFFFGAIHFHTRLSVDGDGDPQAAYAYARDDLQLDVCAMTDHAPVGPYWEECLAANEACNDPGRFVTLPAWESSNSYGHANVYLQTAASDAGPWLWDPDLCPSEVEWPADAIVVPHHTNAGQPIPRGQSRQLLAKGLYWGKYDWSVPNPRVRLAEIVQGRGCFESDAPDPEWGVRLGNQGASLRDALARGWHLGFVAGTDNHEGHPTQTRGQYVGLTCFRAAELTREAIWQAMDSRRTYATTGVPIVADFSLGGIAMGAQGTCPGKTAPLTVRVHGTAPITCVELIVNGDCLWRRQPDAWDVELEEEIELPPEAAYAYVRLRQTDGHRAWLSPVILTV